QLRPEIEPDGSVEDGTTANFVVLLTASSAGTGLVPCPTRGCKRTSDIVKELPISQKNYRCRQSQEKAQLSNKGLSGWA
ncbi:hypothetical protein, partial [uncultured Parabacteroides sp.]|uniref:hypothetical protein n=1 Tax=uncultured Parabacteroides sp. TaxID=512312 RepID=UPI00260A37BC